MIKLRLVHLIKQPVFGVRNVERVIIHFAVIRERLFVEKTKFLDICERLGKKFRCAWLLIHRVQS